jgi:hypothetical protein
MKPSECRATTPATSLAADVPRATWLFDAATTKIKKETGRGKEGVEMAVAW